MSSIVYDYKEVGKAARKLSSSFDWYPTRKDETPEEIDVKAGVGQFRRIGNVAWNELIARRRPTCVS